MKSICQEKQEGSSIIFKVIGFLLAERSRSTTKEAADEIAQMALGLESLLHDGMPTTDPVYINKGYPDSNDDLDEMTDDEGHYYRYNNTSFVVSEERRAIQNIISKYDLESNIGCLGLMEALSKRTFPYNLCPFRIIIDGISENLDDDDWVSLRKLMNYLYTMTNEPLASGEYNEPIIRVLGIPVELGYANLFMELFFGLDDITEAESNRFGEMARVVNNRVKPHDALKEYDARQDRKEMASNKFEIVPYQQGG